MILVAGFLISFSAQYSVVVLPLPVGPGDQQNSVRQADQLIELGSHGARHANTAQV